MNRYAWFADVLKKHDRVGVTGAPKTGKTTLCKRAPAMPVVHGDDFKHLGWSESSEALMKHVNAIRGPVLVEGVSVPRAIRKGMRLDVLIVLDHPFEEPTEHQSAMAKGIGTVLSQLDIPILYAPRAPRENDEEETDDEK